MRLSLILAALVVTCPVVMAQPGPPVAEMVRSSNPADAPAQIEFDLKQFVGVLNNLQERKGDPYEQITTYLSASRTGFFGVSEWVTFFLSQRNESKIRFDALEVEAVEGDTARVKVTTSVLTPNKVRDENGGTKEETYTNTGVETLTFRREKGDFRDPNYHTVTERWRIVAPAFVEASKARPLTLQSIAYFAGQRPETLVQLRGMIASYRLKACALAVLQFCQDYDRRFRFTNDFWAEAALPYTKNESTFWVPGTKTPFTFNDNLSDRKHGDLTDPSRTVLFYEGQNKKPLFRYNGKAIIGFADGHVSSITEDEVEDLKWSS